MESKQIKEAFSCVRASENMTQAVLDIPAQETDHRSPRCPVWVRCAAAAAVVALLIGAMCGFPGIGEKPAPFFTIQVYANETDETGHPSLHLDSAPPSSQKPMFFIYVWLDTDLSIFMPDRKDERPTLTVLCNGEIVKNEKGNDIMIGLLASTTSDDVGYWVGGRVDKPSMLEVTLTAPDNTILQKCIVLVLPALSGGYVVKLIYTYVTDSYEINTL